MTERIRRQWAACEAQSLERGGATIVAQATGLSRTTIWAGRRELQRRADQPQENLVPKTSGFNPRRRPAPIQQDNSAILTDLQALIESSTRGDPQSPLRWTSESTRRVADELRK